MSPLYVMSSGSHKNIDPNKESIDVIMFYKASNVQLSGDPLKIN